MGMCCSKQTDGHKVKGSKSGHPQLIESKESFGHLRKIFDLEQNIESNYKFGKVIGGGHFGTVRIASLINEPSKKFAIKTINKDSIDTDVNLLINQIRTLREVDHPNIIKFYETYNDERYLHIVMELCTGGQLFEYIIRKGRISEASSCKIIKKILHGIWHLHDLNIVHRDLKPENFLFQAGGRESEPKIIDFGLARHFSKGKKDMSTVVGSPYYVAPQVLHGKYDQSCDMWSLGVILYVMLCGYPPFDGPTKNSIFKAILKGQLQFDQKDWAGTSDQVKDLISKLLVRDPKQRLSAEKALEHQWFSIALKGELLILDTQILNRLKKFRAPQLFQKEVLNVIVNMLSPSEIKQLKQTFHAIDIEGNGMISFDELERAFKESGMDIASDEIKRILYTVDIDKNGQINYSQFLAATMDRKKAFNKQKLWLAFKHFDTDKKNYLTKEALKKVFMREGKNYSDEQIESMIKQADLVDQDGKITFEEFCILMGYFGEDGQEPEK